MKKWIHLLLVFFITHAVSAQQLRLATYRYADNDRIKNIQPLARHLQTQLGDSVSVTSYPTVHAFISAIRNNEVDIALINTFGYLLLEASGTGYPMRPALALEVKPDAKDNYKTAFVVAGHSPIKDLADIFSQAKQTRMALVAQGSTSGNLVPRLALNGAGISDAESSFRSVLYSRTHANALQMLINDSADVAAMGYTEFSKLQHATLRMIWLSPEIPLGPVLLNTRLSSPRQQAIRQSFLRLQEQNAQALSAVKAGWSEAKQASHYIAIDGSFYHPFKKSLGKKEQLQKILEQFAN